MAIPLFVNVTDEASVEEMMNQVYQRRGHSISLLVTLVSSGQGALKSKTLKDFQFVTNVDYTGFFICSKFASVKCLTKT